MDTMECLVTRRSVRKYKPDPVSKECLIEIVAAAACAPSAVNRQHWHFVVLHSPEKMEEFRSAMGRVAEKTRPELEARFQNHPQVIRDTEGFLVSLGGAPVCVLAFLHEDYPDRDNAVQSVSAAVENLLLAAWSKGLGSCWMTAPVSTGFGPALRDRFAPGSGELVAAVALGWPDQAPGMPKRKPGRVVFL